MEKVYYYAGSSQVERCGRCKSVAKITSVAFQIFDHFWSPDRDPLFVLSFDLQ